MGMAMDLVSGKVVNAGATFTALTFATGDSGSIRNFDRQNPAYIENAWGQEATAGILRIHSPRMHDNVQGIRMGVLAADPRPLILDEVEQMLYPQDVLTIEATGGGAESDAFGIMVYYTDLPGSAARLTTWDEIKPRIRNFLTVETQHTTGATAGDYGGQLAINANFDLLKANVDYAILGYEVSAACTSVAYRGPDTGNLRCGGPGTTQKDETRNWFVRNSRNSGRPMIPVINAANKGSTLVDLVSTVTSTANVVQTILAELGT